MLRSPNYTKLPFTETYSDIIDVRSQSEFTEDRIIGAINLPVLNDEERAKVGTLYKQCPFTARKLGAALVAQNIAQHLTTYFADKEKDYHPLIYCWRGGQRSNSLAMVVSQIGWQVTIIEGGYKTYRAYVREQLEHLPEKFTYRVLAGMTGSGKTHILRHLAALGVQVLDLEGLANHRGSLLGEEWESRRGEDKEKKVLSPNPQSPVPSPQSPVPNPQSPTPSPQSQPSQKHFESLLLHELQSFDPNLPVWVEAESNKIGRVYLPKSVWQQMQQSSGVEIELPLNARIQWLLQEYPQLIAHPEVLKGKLEKLKSRYGGEKIKEWYRLIDAQEWENLVGDLLACHYDPSYNHAIHRCFPKIERVLSLPELSDASVTALLKEF
ncbi:tRNA 2-selenouridine(34) synthase MnmH [Trichocoleus sp. FACHB-90]|uniref:tRNA 2-selenouridine(34) synthase MnmH n=1 Tax=Cyanophyceae TaxID=3028117 RepID=UPI001684A3DE|nr:tRNA 2-selenouridine(34) synthase MnmH [Trichocoleus sp. FACHB-90]